MLNISGTVTARDGRYIRTPCGGLYASMEWPIIGPFAQGYIRALFAGPVKSWAAPSRPFGFSDLAPETLERVIADCDMSERAGAPSGEWFYQHRQAGAFVSMQPVEPYMGHDGLVYLR